jgi:hypothetical protein
VQTAVILLLAAAAAGPRFRVQPLAVEGDVASVVPADLDGDGKKDLLAVYTTGLPPYQRRFIAVFWNRAGVFAPRPDLVLPVDESEACAFDVGVVGAPEAPPRRVEEELVILTPRGLLAQSFRGRVAGAPRKLLEQPTLFNQPVSGELPRVRVVHDVAGPASHDLLVPSVGALGIWKRNGPAYEKTAELEVDMEVASGGRRSGGPGGKAAAIPAIELRYAFPAIHLADFDGDGLRDIIATQEDRVAVYRQAAGLLFHPQPDFTRDFAVRTASDHRERSSNANVLVADLDGDGIADLVVRKQVFQGVASAASTSYVFYGKKGGGYAKAAAQELTSEGIGLLQVQLLDVTGDGRPDLVVPYTSFGVFALIRMLTAKTAGVDLQIFPFEPKPHRFAPEPAFERRLKFRIPLSGDSDLQAISLAADFTGDGKPDLVFGVAEDELAIYPALGGGEFAEDPAETVAVRAAGVLDTVDLDGKGRSDLVLHYPQTRGHRGEIVVLVNLGPW